LWWLHEVAVVVPELEEVVLVPELEEAGLTIVGGEGSGARWFKESIEREREREQMTWKSKDLGEESTRVGKYM
jgi:hypothetical protein